jgi:hypothetical protein
VLGVHAQQIKHHPYHPTSQEVHWFYKHPTMVCQDSSTDAPLLPLLSVLLSPFHCLRSRLADLASPQSHIDATSSFSPTAFQEASTAAPAAGATTAAGGGGLGGSGGGGVPAGWASGRHNSGEINPTSLDVERLGSGGLLGE